MEELKRVLYVEDDEDDIELTMAAFAENRLANEVKIARDGKEALDYIFCRGNYRKRPDGNPLFVLLDLKLPGIGGIEVLRTIKLNDKTKNIPVIVLTSSKEDKDLKTCYSLGVNAYIVKPVDFKEFMDAVKLTGGFWAVVNEPPPGCVTKFKKRN